MLPFLLRNIPIKKLVFLISGEGKKWGFHYLYDHKWWEKVGMSGVKKWGKMGRGDYPPSKAPLTFCLFQKKLSPNHMWKTFLST